MNDRNDLNNNGDVALESIEVREMELDDCKKMMELDHAAVSESILVFTDGKLVVKKGHWENPDWTKERKEQLIKGTESDIGNPNVILIGAYYNFTMVGFTRLHLISLKNRERTWEVGWLLVSNGYRRRGIATRMMKLAKKRVVEAGGEAICLLGTPDEFAVRFWLSIGFKPLNVPDDEHWSWWDGEDIYMELKI